MKKLATCLIVIIISIALLSGSLASGFLNDPDAIEKAAKSVLKIFVYETPFDEDYFATGSGFVAFNGSTLITNYHVIDGAHAVFVQDDDDNVYELDKVLCADKKADIAILGFSEPSKLKPLELYPDNNLKRGAPVLAIGSPKGLKNTVSSGIVSYQYDDDGIPEIQITAPISPGSSGGALFNDDGKVIGVTSAIYRSTDENGESTDAQNLNFAVNIAVAQAMYNAWDGTRYTLWNYKSTAKMDFTNVYNHDGSKQTTTGSNKGNDTPKEEAPATTESWTCLNCGKENTTRFCLECGAEKPYWVCACGMRYTSNKFCGECGKSYEELINSFNDAMFYASQHNYTKAITRLEDLGSFDSGSFETSEGKHSIAADYIGKVYYDQGLYLISINENHADILKAFELAGDYPDAKEQYAAEENRYYKGFYDRGIDKLSNNDFATAIDSLEKAGEYQDAKEQIKLAYYAWGKSLLEMKKYDACREKLKQAGNYKDAISLIKQSYYDEAIELALQGEYDEAVSILTGLGDYSDAEEQIKKVYYTAGENFLLSGETEKAKEYFKKADNYLDAAEVYDQIIEDEKRTIYETAKEAFDQGYYHLAITHLSKIPGYNDVDDLIIEANILLIQGKYEEINLKRISANDKANLERYLTNLSKYKSNDNATLLSKKINYALGLYYARNHRYSNAAESFQKAGDYQDAKEQSFSAHIEQYKTYVKSAAYQTAYNYYKENLVPNGYTQEEPVVKIGYKGAFFTRIARLTAAIGIEKIPKNEELYKDTYEKYVQKLEEHFGMENDGILTVSEYLAINDMLYVGDKGDFKKIIEQLADLSYFQKLEEPHIEYETKYTNRIKNAENKLGLLADGILTKEEREKILSTKVEKPAAPKSLNAQVTNDTVSLSWPKVEGAFYYEVRRNTTVLGTTDKTNWVDKDVITGVSHMYSVKAKKYTTESSLTGKSVEVKKYYKPVKPAELKKSFSKFKGKFVRLNNLKVESWTIESPTGDFSRDSLYINLARKNKNYNLFLLCSSEKEHVEIVIKNYYGWGWDSDKNDLLSKINKLTTVSVTGTVQNELSDWTKVTNVPSVTIDHITWNYNY